MCLRFWVKVQTLSQMFIPQSAKESLALFMRENLQAGQSAMAKLRADQSATGPWDSSQSAQAAGRMVSQSARNKQDELSNLMKKRLATFVRKLIKAEIYGGGLNLFCLKTLMCCHYGIW